MSSSEPKNLISDKRLQSGRSSRIMGQKQTNRRYEVVPEMHRKEKIMPQ